MNNKPKVSILLAVHNPRMDWLAQQLLSINNQDYPNLCLYVCDDCSYTVSNEELYRLLIKTVTKFTYIFIENDKNIGSTKTFERLVKEADGEFFAFCDQDDIWEANKISLSVNTIENENALLVCSDMIIIDENGKKTADSITKIRKKHRFESGYNLASELVFKNWVTGCTMLIDSQTAKDAIPFCDYSFHDQYLAFYCAIKGKIISIPDKTVQYRLYGYNQTSPLAGIKSKADYIKIRIDNVILKNYWLMENVQITDKFVLKTINEYNLWLSARKRWLLEKRELSEVLKFRKFGKMTAIFEIASFFMPNRMFEFIIYLYQHNHR